MLQIYTQDEFMCYLDNELSTAKNTDEVKSVEEDLEFYKVLAENLEESHFYSPSPSLDKYIKDYVNSSNHSPLF